MISPEEELDHRRELASTKLQVSEELGGCLSVCVGYIAYGQWNSWLMAVLIAIALYNLIIYRPNKEYERAWEAKRQLLESEQLTDN